MFRGSEAAVALLCRWFLPRRPVPSATESLRSANGKPTIPSHPSKYIKLQTLPEEMTQVLYQIASDRIFALISLNALGNAKRMVFSIFYRKKSGSAANKSK